MSDADAARLAELGYEQGLRRSLRLRDLVVYGLVFMLPIAPFTIFGVVLDAARGMVALTYVIGLVAMLFTALSYREMSRAFPVAGSVYAYAGRGVAEWLGFLAVNLLGIEITAVANRLFLVAELVVLAVFVAAAVVAVSRGVNGATWSARPFFDAAQFTPSIVFAALSIAVLSFLGFDAISTLSEEVRGGPRVVGRATVVALFLAAGIFVVQTWLAGLLLPGVTSFRTTTRRTPRSTTSPGSRAGRCSWS